MYGGELPDLDKQVLRGEQGGLLENELSEYGYLLVASAVSFRLHGSRSLDHKFLLNRKKYELVEGAEADGCVCRTTLDFH